jgi:hypothetical protein
MMFGYRKLIKRLDRLIHLLEAECARDYQGAIEANACQRLLIASGQDRRFPSLQKKIAAPLFPMTGRLAVQIATTPDPVAVLHYFSMWPKEAERLTALWRDEERQAALDAIVARVLATTPLPVGSLDVPR